MGPEKLQCDEEPMPIAQSRSIHSSLEAPREEPAEFRAVPDRLIFSDTAVSAAGRGWGS